ncbi:transposase Tn5 [Candidatus Vecturithrix granuli]|uniref:Transposase Tn5 n=1 Tax=Vecturithrix granuli TaxID=1499967 RepID=A0A081BXH3_VECG1|nr:transposase Tn5 [Candidatus Vecturithrix granuli]
METVDERTGSSRSRQTVWPSLRIPQASRDWASTTAAYRLCANPKVSAARILEPHQRQTCRRMAGESRILAGQETCFLNYTSHPTTETGQMRLVLRARPVSGYVTVAIPAQPQRPARTATVEVRYGEVTLRPPSRDPSCQADLRPLTLAVVWAREVEASGDVATPLEWLLMTTVSIQTFLDAVERMRWYRLRWHIEIFHKVLKSGCRIADYRLATVDKLVRSVTLKSVVAWQMQWMGPLHRTSTLPEAVPTVHQMVRWIAKLGGFLGRKHDREPGGAGNGFTISPPCGTCCMSPHLHKRGGYPGGRNTGRSRGRVCFSVEQYVRIMIIR